MSVAHTNGAALRFDIIDLVPPWIANPQTILFHHGLGMIRQSWNAWLPALIGRFRIVTFDTRGHGESTWENPDSPLTLEDFRTDLLAVANAAGLDRFHVVGESLGGTIGLLLGITVPERLHSLTICNAAHRGEKIQATDHFRDYLAREGMAAWSASMMPGRFHIAPETATLRSWYERVQASIAPQTVLGIRDALVGADISDRAGDIRTPCLLMNGDSSPFIAPDMTADLHARLADSEMAILPKARHGLPVSHGPACAAILRDYLDRRFP